MSGDTNTINMFEGDDIFSPGIVSDETISVEVGEQEKPETTKKLNLNYASGTYADKPSLPDQFSKYPDTVKIGFPQAAVFNLKDKNDLKDYNALLKDTFPDTSPSILISDTRLSEDFTVMVIYTKLTYLIPG